MYRYENKRGRQLSYATPYNHSDLEIVKSIDLSFSSKISIFLEISFGLTYTPVYVTTTSLNMANTLQIVLEDTIRLRSKKYSRNDMLQAYSDRDVAALHAPVRRSRNFE